MRNEIERSKQENQIIYTHLSQQNDFVIQECGSIKQQNREDINKLVRKVDEIGETIKNLSERIEGSDKRISDLSAMIGFTTNERKQENKEEEGRLTKLTNDNHIETNKKFNERMMELGRRIEAIGKDLNANKLERKNEIKQGIEISPTEHQELVPTINSVKNDTIKKLDVMKKEIITEVATMIEEKGKEEELPKWIKENFDKLEEMEVSHHGLIVVRFDKIEKV
jgi:hypothetical protein